MHVPPSGEYKRQQNNLKRRISDFDSIHFYYIN